MKWLGLPLMLLLAFASPATLTAACGSQSSAVDSTCACCAGPDACCLDSNVTNSIPVKTPFAPAQELPAPAAPQFTYVDWFLPPIVQRVQRSHPPMIQVRPPPDPARLCTFLI